MSPAERPDPESPRRICSFCGITRAEAKTLVRGPVVDRPDGTVSMYAICDECTRIALDVVLSESAARGPADLRADLAALCDIIAKASAKHSGDDFAAAARSLAERVRSAT